MKLMLAYYSSFNRFTGPSSVVVSGYSDHQIIQSSGSEFFKSGKYDWGISAEKGEEEEGGGETRVKISTR